MCKRYCFLIFCLTLGCCLTMAQQIVYEENITLHKKDGGRKLLESSLTVYYDELSNTYLLSIINNQELDNEGNELTIWVFGSKLSGKNLKQRKKEIDCDKNAFFKPITDSDQVKFSFSGEKKIQKQADFSFLLNESVPKTLMIKLQMYVGLTKKKKIELIEAVPVIIRFTQPDEKKNPASSNNKKSAISLDVDTVLSIPSDPIERQEYLDSLKTENKKSLLSEFISESNDQITQLIIAIQQTNESDIEQEKKDSVEFLANIYKERVDRRKHNPENINILESNRYLEDEFTNFDAQYNTVSKKMGEWQQIIDEKKGKEINWLIVGGACLFLIMVLFPIISQISSKREMRKQQKQQEKLAEEERLKQLFDDDNIPTI